MVAVPLKLDAALNLQGYTIDVVESEAFDIEIDEGTIHVPDMLLQTLTWHRERDEEPIDSLYLKHLPVFDEAYRPIILSSILGHFRSRRIGYHTPGEFGNAVLRWGNENLGPMSVFNARWRSTAIELPLDTQNLVEHREHTEDEVRSPDIVNEGYDHTLNTGSDFPQSLISGSGSYATSAGDTRFATNRREVGTETKDAEGEYTKTNTGRDRSIMELLEEQRRQYINVDAEFRAAFEVLMLSTFDIDEGEPQSTFGLPGRWGWYRSPLEW